MPRSTKLPAIGVVSSNYLTREALKAVLDGTLGHFIPGLSSGRLVSAVTADRKCAALQRVASRYYTVNFDMTFTGEIETVADAIVYASQKKGTKGVRQAVVATAEQVGALAGAVIGGAAGSVALPVAGSVAGLTVGVAAGKGAVGLSYHMFRKGKWAYKKVKGTQGVHRLQAADTLYSAATAAEDGRSGRDQVAASAALLIILGAEYEHFMEDKPELAVERIADRLKSV